MNHVSLPFSSSLNHILCERENLQRLTLFCVSMSRMGDRFDSYCAICGFVLSLEFSFSGTDTFVPASDGPERNILFRDADVDDVGEEGDKEEGEKEVPKPRPPIQIPMAGPGTGVPAIDNYDWGGYADAFGEVEEDDHDYVNYLVYDEYDEEVKSDGIGEIVENEKGAYVEDPANIPMSSYFGYTEFMEAQAARNREAAERGENADMAEDAYNGEAVGLGEDGENEEDSDIGEDADTGEDGENEEDADHEDHGDHEEDEESEDYEDYEEDTDTEDGYRGMLRTERNCRCRNCSRWRMAMRQQQQYAAETNGPPVPLDPFTREPDERVELLARPPLAGPEAAWARELRVIGGQSARDGVPEVVWESGARVAMGDIAGSVHIDERLLDSIAEAFGRDVITESDNQGAKPHLPIYKVTRSRKALFIPFHDSCRAVLCRYMGTEPAELDSQALFETFRSLVGRPHNWRKLCVDYGDMSRAHRGLFHLLPGDEHFLYDPLRVSGLEESLRDLPRVSGKDREREKKGKGKEKRYDTRGDPFAALAPELLLLVLEALPDADAIGAVRRASPAFANLALDASYWRAKVARDMPWLWELGGLLAAPADDVDDDAGREDPVDWARLYWKMSRASNENARGKRMFGLCNRKRIWEQMCPQFAGKYQAAVRSRNY